MVYDFFFSFNFFFINQEVLSAKPDLLLQIIDVELVNLNCMHFALNQIVGENYNKNDDNNIINKFYGFSVIATFFFF